MTTNINLTIDGIAISVPKGTTVYQAARELGIDIPIFCYQDRMPPFGACRVCLVEVEKMGKLQTSCTLEATEGMVVKTQSDPAVKGREGILEFLLVNHPLDCPICDRGGECPLQDQALKFGPGESRFTEEKRHFTKSLPLGSVLMLDRERCIVCARCTRFGDEIAGDHALQFIDRGFRTEVGTPDGKPVQSKFIGNTIMICPVGALTSQVYRFRARPWDNKPTETTCTLCPVGCSMILDSRDGEIMRTRSQENKSLNDIWLCDKGWFGYEFNSNPERLETPLIRKNGKFEKADWEEALSLIASRIQQSNKDKVAGIGGNSLTVEENYLFQKLIRDSIGSPNVDHRVGMPIFSLDEEGLEAGMEMKIGDCEELSYAILLGFDITEEFPVIWLRLKQAINNKAKVVFIGHYAPEISRYLREVITHQPGKEIEVLHAQNNALNELAKAGAKGAIFVGKQYLHTPNRKAILSEVLKLKQSLPNCKLNIMEGRDNSVGARFAGMRPDLKPGGEKASHIGLSSIQVFNEAAKSGWDILYIAGSNPAAKLSSKLCKEVRAKTKFIIVQDMFLTETAKEADVVLPVLSYAEKSGSFINIEGRVQKIRQGKKINKTLKTDSEIFVILGEKLGKRLVPEQSFIDKLNQEFIPLPQKSQLESGKTTTNTHPLSATFAHYLFDNGVRISHDPHLIKLAKEPKVRLNPIECFKRNLKDGDKILVKANGITISSKAKSDDRVSEGTAVLPLGFKEFHVQNLTNDYLNGMPIEIQNSEDGIQNSEDLDKRFLPPYTT